MSSGVNAMKSTTESQVFPASARDVAAASKMSAVIDFAPAIGGRVARLTG